MRNSVTGWTTALAILGLATAAQAQTVDPSDLGIVEAPTAGSTSLPLNEVPAVVKHTAQVAFKYFDGRATLTSAQIDQDEVEAVYEIRGQTRDGRILEADILPDATLVELEIEISRNQVPDAVSRALRQFAPQFNAATERPAIEKSVRPSKGSLSEIWYEFSGTTFDVEIRSDGKAILIEPA